MVLSRKTYKWFYDHVFSRCYNAVIKWCFLPLGGEKTCREELLSPVEFSPDDQILDMCCGTGGATRAISEKAGRRSRIVGLDLSAGQLRVARKQPELSHVRFVEGDAARSPFQDAVFDKVFIAHAIHEMPRELRLTVLGEGRRILKDSGQVIILELDNPPSLWVRLLLGLWCFHWLPFNFETSTRKDMLRHGVVEEMRETGFTDVTKESKYGGVFQVVRGVK